MNVDTAAQDAPLVDRRERLQHTIDALIRLRQSVVVSYCKMAGVNQLAPRGGQPHKVNADELREFCQVMVDYTAMGHFEVYQRIMEGKERRQAVRDVADQVYPGIAETTDYLVDFNDKYDDFVASDDEIEQLQGDLGQLGEMLAVRGELEDRILDALQQKKAPNRAREALSSGPPR